MNSSEFEKPDALDEALKDLGREAVDPVLLASVRRRVMGEVVNRRPSLLYAWRWKYALAVAAVVVLAVVAGVSVRRPVELKPAEVAVATSPARVPAQRAEEDAPPRRPARVPARQAKEPAPRTEAQPLLVKLVTDDPEVVIYWLVDQKGDRT